MSASLRVPRLIPVPQGKSLQSYPLTPVDGFVLSRIDGVSSDTDIVTFTGLDDAAVRGSLDKLVALGLVAFGSSPPNPTETESTKALPHGGTPPQGQVPAPKRSSVPPAPSNLYDPAELEEDVDIEPQHRKKVLDLFYQLDTVDHYALLGVSRTADKKEIKRSYYESAGLFHPDRFFRKRLGSFKAKMEQVFSRITLAHDTLTKKEDREEYDAYLGDQQQAAAIEADLQVEVAPMPETVPPPQATSSAPQIIVAEKPTSSTPPRPAVSEQARREALARRLMSARSSAPPPRVSSSAGIAVDQDVLRRHYESRVEGMRERLVKQHVENAHGAMAKSDWVAALNAFKLAMAAAPNDAELRASLVEAQAKANEQLGENYRRQAQYEEKGQRWPEAARSWARAARTLPKDAIAQQRAAHSMLKADGNLHEAAALAQRAISLDPTKPAFRVTLAEIYLAAGLALNAKRELEAALLLSPGDAIIQGLLKRVKA